MSMLVGSALGFQGLAKYTCRMRVPLGRLDCWSLPTSLWLGKSSIFWTTLLVEVRGYEASHVVRVQSHFGTEYLTDTRFCH